MPSAKEAPAPAGARLRVARGLVPAVVVVVACGVVATDAASMGPKSFAGFLVIALVVLTLIRRMASVQREVDHLVSSESRFRALVQQSNDVTLIFSPDGTITYASPSVEDLLGLSASDVVGSALSGHVHPEDTSALTWFVRGASEGGTVIAEWRVRRAEEWIWTENTSTDLREEPGIEGIVITSRDISERRSLEAQLTHQAFHDSLTRLANRSLFLNRVAHAIARAPRGGRQLAVLFLDLDGFKKVNDSLGHAAGDELLVACASRLATSVRPGDTIARLGGDEFAVLLEGITGLPDAEQIAERIATAVNASFTVRGREVFVGVSVGIAEVGLEQSPEVALRNADLAMYFAKSRHKGRYAIYEPTMHQELVEWMELEADLRAAISANEIAIAYQPIVHLATGRLYGAEALVRWRHPKRGLVEPSRLIAIAEETGLIIPVGRQVLEEACAQASAWRRDHRRAESLRLSVNLSGRHFQEPSLLDDVRGALERSGLEPSALTLEITESVLMQSESTLTTLRALKSLGVRLAIDDFGIGYSSLGYLQRFPIDILKIDRTFVDSVALADADPVLVRAIIALGRTLRIETIAEGIERLEQRDGLQELGCELGQGFFFAPALPPAEFDRRLLHESEDKRLTPDYGSAFTPAPVS